MTLGLLDNRSREVTWRVWSSLHRTSRVSSTEHSWQKSSQVQSCRRIWCCGVKAGPRIQKLGSSWFCSSNGKAAQKTQVQFLLIGLVTCSPPPTSTSQISKHSGMGSEKADCHVSSSVCSIKANMFHIPIDHHHFYPEHVRKKVGDFISFLPVWKYSVWFRVRRRPNTRPTN